MLHLPNFVTRVPWRLLFLKKSGKIARFGVVTRTWFFLFVSLSHAHSHTLCLKKECQRSLSELKQKLEEATQSARDVSKRLEVVQGERQVAEQRCMRLEGEVASLRAGKRGLGGSTDLASEQLRQLRTAGTWLRSSRGLFLC